MVSSEPAAAPAVRRAPDAAPGLTVAAVARRLGVAPATLRTWDRRYGLGPSGRTAGEHRRYCPDDLARLDLMRRLVHTGVPPADAARVALAAVLEPAGPPDVPGPGQAAAATHHVGSVPLPPSAPAYGEASDAGPDLDPLLAELGMLTRAPGGGAVIPLPSATPAVRGLARAALSLDSVACTELVRETLERRGVVWTWDHLLVPLLVGVGVRWESTGRGVEVEHLLSESCIAALSGVITRLRTPVNPRPVLLACADEEMHSLPLFAVSAALSERRVGARVLGARVPGDALVAAIRRTGPAAVLVWSHLPSTGDPLQLAGLPDLRPAPVVLAAGPGWTDPLPPEVVRVDDLVAAVARIAHAVDA